MKVIIAAAQTGGHINPGIAIANKIKEKNKNAKIILCSGILLFLICLVLIIFSINQIINIGCGISGFILLLFGIMKLNNKKIDI